MTETSKVIELIVGHSSSRLSGTQENGHTHQWTLFVKPANKDYDDFPDNKLIQKVKFQIHDSFPNPIRTVSKPPFRVSETGFASFSSFVTVYLNLPHAHEKYHTIPYELNLFTGEQDVQEEVQKLGVRGVFSTAFADQVKRYCKTKKRKTSIISPHEQKSPTEAKKMKREKSDTFAKIDKEKHKEKHHPNNKKAKGLSTEMFLKNSKTDAELSFDLPVKQKETFSTSENKSYGISSPSVSINGKSETAEDLTEKLNSCSDPYVIYKVSEFLLTLPNTILSTTTMRLSFDLANSSQSTLSEISRLMKITKKSKNVE